MRFHTPAFWYQPSSLTATLLSPFAFAYQQWIARSRHSSTARFSVPIFCIGNITAGGAGKTPVVIALISLLSAYKVHVVSRGYGGRREGPLRVEDVHTAEEVGDEPLLLARYAPTWIAKSRQLGIEAAIRAGAEMILLDDGFQNPSIHKDVSLLVIDGSAGIGNGRLLPAGPLREPLTSALHRTQGVIIIGKDQQQIAAEIKNITPHLPLFHASLTPTHTAAVQGKRVMAFAGIGRPEKFFTSLKQAGALLSDTHAFPDHYPFSLEDIRALQRAAAKQEALLITTEKDAVRLPPPIRKEIMTFPVEVTFEEEGAVKALLENALGQRVGAAWKGHKPVD